jgi:hypothetical protein
VFIGPWELTLGFLDCGRMETDEVEEKELGESMGSNNYSEVMTDMAKAQKVTADLNSLAAQGRTFTLLEFNPDKDRFAISCGRESNFPTLQDVEEGVTLSTA